MNAPLRKVGVVVLVLFAMLFLNLNWVQAYKAEAYRTSKYNGRVQVDEYSRARGKIMLANGVVVAESVATTDNLKYLRTYPFKDEYAHIVGRRPVNNAATNVEDIQDDFLNGNAASQAADRFIGMFTGKRPPGGNVLLTLSRAGQDTAYRELGNNELNVHKGAIVMLDPKTGGVLAAVSLPSYDPNPLVSHDSAKANTAANTLDKDPNKPLNNRAFSETLAPGSTFKVIMSAAALTNGMTPDTVIPAGQFYTPPQTSLQIKNASPQTCPGDQITLKQALTVSCNTAFARLGVEQLGKDKIQSMAEAFGFTEKPTFVDDDDNVMNVAASQTGPMVDPPAVAQSSIGQRDVRMTVLQGALVAATVANDGRQMRPYVVDTLQSADLSVVSKTKPSQLRRPVSDQVAGGLQDMMISVVQSGTGKPAQINGFRVGGKTGTAENGEDTSDHGWFIGFAMKGNEPVAAVAVVLEGAGKGGSHEAARIAGAVMKAYIDERGLR